MLARFLEIGGSRREIAPISAAFLMVTGKPYCP
jgi:hypothetical protein